MNNFALIQLLFLSLILSVFTEADYFPDKNNWAVSSPEAEGTSAGKVDKLIDLAFADSATQGVVVIKNGKIIGEKYTDGYSSLSHGTSWSMAKSYYAALIGISIDRGEIGSLDDKVSKYLNYYDDERSNITIRDLLDMSSGLEFPSHEHERMFFQMDHLEYAKKVKADIEPGTKFEYNNVNSMILGDILLVATGEKADVLLEKRILQPLNIVDYKLWKDEQGNVMTYCCVDMSARDYSKIGLLFSRNGNWEGNQIISSDYVNETFQVVWETPNRWSEHKRYYSLHWWVSRYDENSKIFNTSGKFGQFTFVDRENDVIVTRITKYNQNEYGSTQKWGPMKYFAWAGIDNAINVGRTLLMTGTIKEGDDVITPYTFDEGASTVFYQKYQDFIDAISNISST